MSGCFFWNTVYMYIQGLAIVSARSSPPTPPLIFTALGQKVWNLASSSTPLVFELSSFRNEVTDLQRSRMFNASMMDLCSIWSTPPLPIWEESLKICPSWKKFAAECSISLKFGREFDRVTSDLLQKFKVKWSKVKVTAWYNVSASEVTCHERIGWLSLNCVKINYSTA